MKIRRATAVDIEESLEIAKNLKEWFTADALKKMQNDFKRNLIVAFDKKIVGFLNYKINKNSMRILWIGVKRKNRGKGVGRKLLGELRGIAGKNNISKLLVNTLSYEDEYAPYISTRQFYLDNGFVYKYIKRAKKLGHDDQVVMEKLL